MTRRDHARIPTQLTPAWLIIVGLLVAMVLCIPPLIHSAAWVYHRTPSGWEPAPGLPGPPERLERTADGTLWVATNLERALCRRQGAVWACYEEADLSLPSGDGSELSFTVAANTVWVARGRRIARFAGEGWTVQPEILDAEVLAMTGDEGGVWAVTRAGTLWRVGASGASSSSLTALPPTGSWETGEEVDLGVGPSNTLWLVAGGLWLRMGDAWRSVPTPAMPIHILRSGGGMLWVETADGFVSFDADGTIARQITARDIGLPVDARLTALSVGPNGLLVAGASQIFRETATGWQPDLSFQGGAALPGGKITALLAFSDDSVWVAMPRTPLPIWPLVGLGGALLGTVALFAWVGVVRGGRRVAEVGRPLEGGDARSRVASGSTTGSPIDDRLLEVLHMMWLFVGVPWVMSSRSVAGWFTPAGEAVVRPVEHINLTVEGAVWAIGILSVAACPTIVYLAALRRRSVARARRQDDP